MRPSGRKLNQMRDVVIETGVNHHAEGSCLIKVGDTHVLCTASLEERVPPFLRNSGLGWVTAEYGMLPRATHTRMRREAKNGQSGRTQEIQRLIGRSLRAGVDRVALGERQISIDCDVIQADGGTRTAAITGAYVALVDACRWLLSKNKIKKDVNLGSHAQYVPHIGLPQIAPVSRATKVKTIPTCAADFASSADTWCLRINQISEVTSIMIHALIAISAAGTCK